MKKHLLSQAAALCMLAPAALFTQPVAAATTAVAVAPQTRGLEVNADSGIAPGSLLRFKLEATPGGQASARVPGLDAPVPLKEVAPGQYTGRYTVRRTDRIDPAAVIKVSLTSAGRTALANYTFPPSFMAPEAAAPARPTVAAPPTIVVQPAAAPLRIERFVVAPLVNDYRPPQIGNLLPRQGETVAAGSTLVSGSLDDAHGSGVDPQSVRIVVSGRDVTSLAQVTPREFSLHARLPPGRHTVEVTAADRAGNVAQKSWSFDVGSVVLGAPSAVLPLMVMSHQNNGFVGQDVTTIRGRTAPFATVLVRVDAITPTGRRVESGVAQRLLEQSVQADANGDFSFDFSPRYVRDNASSLPVPGTRYDVSISASRDNATSESRLMLFQRG